MLLPFIEPDPIEPFPAFRAIRGQLALAELLRACSATLTSEPNRCRVLAVLGHRLVDLARGAHDVDGVANHVSVALWPLAPFVIDYR
jgi:hypothetical protein